MHLVFAGDVRYLLPVEQDLSQNPCLVLRFQAATFLSFRFVFFCHKAFPCLEIYTLLALTFSSKLRVSATPDVKVSEKNCRCVLGELEKKYTFRDLAKAAMNADDSALIVYVTEASARCGETK